MSFQPGVQQKGEETRYVKVKKRSGLCPLSLNLGAGNDLERQRKRLAPCFVPLLLFSDLATDGMLPGDESFEQHRRWQFRDLTSNDDHRLYELQHEHELRKTDGLSVRSNVLTVPTVLKTG